MHYVKTQGRYLGFIVYPGSTVDPATREATITLMDSLHVNPYDKRGGKTRRHTPTSPGTSISRRV